MSYEIHPAAAVWPMMSPDELRVLAEDIKANGLRQPIALTPDGKLLAGRNRLAACEIAGVEPTTRVEDGDPFAYVLSENRVRGHYSTPQLAMATALVLTQQGKRRNGRWARGSVPTLDSQSKTTWSQAMALAGTVLDEVPELGLAVVAGTTSLDAAYTTANDRRKAKAEAAQKMADSFGMAVHVLAGFADAEDAVADLVAAYGPPSLPIARDDLDRASRAVELIMKGWTDD